MIITADSEPIHPHPEDESPRSEPGATGSHDSPLDRMEDSAPAEPVGNDRSPEEAPAQPASAHFSEHAQSADPINSEPQGGPRQDSVADSDIPFTEDSAEPFDAEFLDLLLQIEALIFASDEALHPKVIRHALEKPDLEDALITRAVSRLNQKYEHAGLTFRIQRIAQGYRFFTIREFYSTIQKLMQPKLQRRLSQAALETLAIISYKQPLSKSEIEAIRGGTSVDHVLRMLLEKNLIEVTGRSESLGKPLLYGTTKAFLDYFNLPSLQDLPKPREIDELMREDEQQAYLKQELNARLKVELEEDASQTQSNQDTAAT